MGRKLNKHQLKILREVVEKHSPELADEIIPIVSQMEKNIRIELMRATMDELQSSGFVGDWEITERGRELEELIDTINESNLKE